jgi:hypothetical protein
MAAKRGRAARKVTDERARFSAAMGLWLDAKGYRVGVGGESVDFGQQIAVIKLLAEQASRFLGPFGPVAAETVDLLDTDVSAKEMRNALEPIGSIVDLIGFDPHTTANELYTVVYADDLDADRILSRVHAVYEFSAGLREIGPLSSLNLQSLFVQVLIVFHDSARRSAVQEHVLRDGTRQDFISGTLRTIVVDVPAREVLQSPAKGFGIFEEFMNAVTQTDDTWFDSVDLGGVVEAGRAVEERMSAR